MGTGSGVIAKDALVVTGGEIAYANFTDTIEYVSKEGSISTDSKLPEVLHGHCQIAINKTTIFVMGGGNDFDNYSKKTWQVKSGSEVS